MFVFYKIATGNVCFTIDGASFPSSLLTDDIDVIEFEGEISPDHDYSVIDNELVSTPRTISRAEMVITPLQGILTLGETEWDKVLAYRATASFAEKAIIDSAQDWKRTSQNIEFFGYLLGYTDEQMDALFIAAMEVTA
jgi:hypothetical protein